MLLPTRPRRLLGCAAVLTGLALPWPAPSGADPLLPVPPPASVDPLSAFLPAPTPALPDPPDPPLTPSDMSAPLPDLLGPSRAISRAWTQALAGLTSGQASAYESILDAGYTQADPHGGTIGAAQTGQRLDALLAAYRVSTAKFGVTACRMTAPDAATVTVRERLELFTRNTPPTLTPMPNGGTVVTNNTTRLNSLLVLHQDWVLRGTIWKLKRSQMSPSASAATAVL